MVYQRHAPAGEILAGRRRHVLLARRQAQRQVERERAAVPLRAVHVQRASHEAHEPRRDREAEAGAAEQACGGPVGLREGLEDGLLPRGRDADAGVTHREVQARLALRIVGQVHEQLHRSGLGELDRVAEQVDEHLPQASRVAEDRGGQARGLVPYEIEALLVRPDRQRAERILEHRREFERGDLHVEAAGLDLREVQHVVDDVQQRLGGAPDRLQVLALGRRRGSLERQFRHAEDAVHRRPNLVTHVGEELALGAARLLGAFLGLLQLPRAVLDGVFEAVAVRLQVAIEGADLAHHVVEGGDHDANLVQAGRRRQRDVEAPGAADLEGGLGQLSQRRDHGFLKPLAEQVRQRERHDEHAAEDGGHAPAPLLEGALVGHQQQPPDAAAFVADVAGDQHAGSFEDRAGGRGLFGQAHAVGGRIAGDGRAGAVVEHRAEHVRPGRERREVLGRHVEVVERQRGIAVGGEHRRRPLEFTGQGLTRRPGVIGEQAGAREGEGARARRDENQGQSTTEGEEGVHSRRSTAPLQSAAGRQS